MLSESEEDLLQFIQTANATPIGTVRARLFYGDFELLFKGLAFIVGRENFARNDPLDSGEEAQSPKRLDAVI